MTRSWAIEPGRKSFRGIGGLVAIASFLVMVGCHAPQHAREQRGEAQAHDPQPHEVRSELPPKEAALTCAKLAEEAEKSGDDQVAITHYLRARALNPAIPDVSRHLADAYERQGDLFRAIEEYGRAIEENPKSADLPNDLGYCYYTMGNWKEAEANYRKAISLKSKNPRAWNNLGLALGQQGRRTESLAAFTHAISKAEAECNLGFVLLTQGKKDEAEDCYRRALELKPDLTLARVKLAELNESKLLASRKTKVDQEIQTASFERSTFSRPDSKMGRTGPIELPRWPVPTSDDARGPNQ